MSEPRISHFIPLTPMTPASTKTAELRAAQIEAQQDLNADIYDGQNLMVRSRNFQTLEERRAGQGQKKEKTEEGKLLTLEAIEEIAEQFSQGNNELKPKTLLILREKIKSTDSPDEILETVLGIYGDPSLADEALDFLIKTADPKLLSKLLEAKEKLNSTYPREIKAGRNIGEVSRQFAAEKDGLGSATSLRDVYRDITGTMREPLNLFSELTSKFSFEKMKTVIQFLLHSLGADLKAKGPSIPAGELKKLIDDTRSLQGILGVFRFFQSRMPLMARQFDAYHLPVPENITYETLGKTFVRLLQERYINPEKIMQTAQLLKISGQLAAQLIIYAQMHDAIKQIAPRYYRNQQHKEEIKKSFLDLLDKLEDELEEEEEEQEKEDEDTP